MKKFRQQRIYAAFLSTLIVLALGTAYAVVATQDNSTYYRNPRVLGKRPAETTTTKSPSTSESSMLPSTTKKKHKDDDSEKPTPSVLGTSVTSGWASVIITKPTTTKPSTTTKATTTTRATTTRATTTRATTTSTTTATTVPETPTTLPEAIEDLLP